MSWGADQSYENYARAYSVAKSRVSRIKRPGLRTTKKEFMQGYKFW